MDTAARIDHVLAERDRFAPTVLRVGLGAVILLEGVHKLLAPSVWAAYAAPWVVALWPWPMVPMMVASGALEIGFGLALVADRYTTLSATVVALSIAFVVVDLATIGLATGRFVDVALRDVGLVALAVGVALQSASDRG